MGSKDPKSVLHEWVLKKYGNEVRVDYPSVNEGTSNAPQFKVRVIIKRKINENIEIEGPWVNIKASPQKTRLYYRQFNNSDGRIVLFGYVEEMKTRKHKKKFSGSSNIFHFV